MAEVTWLVGSGTLAGLLLASCATSLGGGTALQKVSVALISTQHLSEIPKPVALAVGLGSVWVMAPSPEPGSGTPAYGSLLQVSERNGALQARARVGGAPMSVLPDRHVVWVANTASSASLHLAYQDSILGLAVPGLSRITVYSGQALATAPGENPLAADASGVWAITGAGSDTNVTTLGTTPHVLASVPGIGSAIAACGPRLYVATTSDSQTAVREILSSTGAITRTWTIPGSALASLRCTSSGVLLGLSSPTDGGFYELRRGSAGVPRRFGARTQFGVTIVDGNVWTVTADQAPSGRWGVWLFGYSLSTYKQVNVPMRLGSGSRLGPIAPEGLAGTAHTLWAAVGSSLLKIAIGG